MDGQLTFSPLPVNQTVALEAVRYDTATGLVPVVVQDAGTGQVLMLAYANREALKRTFGTGQAWFWSRSRQDYWRKGATSGHVQNVQEVRIDCDGDTVLYLVNPVGPACHTGETSCFYRQMTRDGDDDASSKSADAAAVEGAVATPSSTQVRGPEAVTGTGASTGGGHDVLAKLWQVVEGRWRDRPAGSYTTYLFEQGIDKSSKKVGEEAVEVVIAAKNAAKDTHELATESADLLYHLMVLWRACGLTPEEVYQVLAGRA